jgi:peroxiredoxin
VNLLRSVFESPTVYRLGWALLHFLWEGALVALLVAVVLAALRRRGAPARYVACSVGLLLLAILPAITFLLTPARSSANLKGAASAIDPKPAAIGLLNAPPVHSTGRAVAIPVSAPSPGNSSVIKSQPVAKSAAVAPVPVKAATPVSSALRNVRDFVPRALPWLVLAWCVGALGLSVYNLGGWMAVRRLRLLATSAVAQDLSDAAARLAHRMGIARAVRLLQSTLIDSPMVIGALKPIILLPASLLSGLSPEQLESLLAHELAHVRRHDYLINLLQGVIETLLFYHPAVWWVSRRIRIEREHCCDDQVVAVTRNRAAYVRALAAVAEAAGKEVGREPLFSRASRGAGGFAVGANGGALLPRVRRLLGLPDADAARSPRWLAGAVALALCLLATGTIVTRAADKPAPAKEKDFDAPKTWVLELEVIDKELGEPIPKLSLGVRADNRQFAYITDDQGRAHIEYPQGVKYLVITPKAGGFVPVSLSWRNFGGNDPIPDTFKLQLERGSAIGGIVNDEAGKPIPNAAVQLSIPYRAGEESSRVQLDLYNYPIKTDAQGRWRCDVVPKTMLQAFIRLSHADFLSDETFGETPVPPLPKLRDMTGIMVMKKGLPVAGKVLDDQGMPIGGAKVYQGGDRFGTNYPQTKTDANGNFHFAHCRPGAELVLTVTAKGHAPDQKTLALDKELGDIEFRLEPGHTIKGRIVDPDGKPIPKVLIATDTWRGHRALNERFDTDADGRFVWNDAPADEILTDFLKQGYMDNRRVTIKASDQDIVVTLRKPVRVTGTVVDAETGKSVENFKVKQGIAWENQPATLTADQRLAWAVTWQSGDPEIHPQNGKFEFELTAPYPGYAVRIETTDYLPEESRVFKDNEGDISLEFKLKKGRALAGTLRTPDGKALAGADVVLYRGSNGPYIMNGKINQREQQTIVTSDRDGRYQLPPQAGKFALVVVHELGYAEVRSEQLAKSFDIIVPPWGKVEGTLRIGAKPGALQTINVSHQDNPGPQPEPRIYHDLRAPTDEAGHFMVEHVPGGKASVSLQVQFSEYTYGSTQSRTIDVKPGETTHIDLGGEGRPVIGKLTVPLELAGKMSPATDNTFMLTKIDALPDFHPANWGDLNDAARKKIGEDQLKSPAYLAFQKRIEMRRTFCIKVKSDGTFRVEDIPAGVYQFTSIASEPSNKGHFMGEAMATANVDIAVPEIPGGRSDEPLDVGDIPFMAVKKLKVGDVAPDFSIKTVDGRPLKLGDYKGKYVLVYFWTVGSPTPLPAEPTVLKMINDRFEKDGHLVMLGLSFDEKIDTVKKFIADNKITWPQGFMGDWSKSEIPEQWSLRGMPAVFLIGPEGKIVARDLRGDTIASAVETALRPTPAK